MISWTSIGLKLVCQRRFFSVQRRHFLAHALHCSSQRQEEVLKSKLQQYRRAQSALSINGGALQRPAVLQWRFYGTGNSIGDNAKNSNNIDSNNNIKPKQSLAERTDILLRERGREPFTLELWQEGAAILLWWTGMASEGSIRQSFSLLQLLLVENKKGKFVKQDDEIYLLNTVLRNWSDCIHKEFSGSPRRVVDRVLLNKNKLVSQQASTYAIILNEAASDHGNHASTRDNKVRRLWTYIEELCGDDDEELKLEIDACARNILIQMWARDGHVIKTINMTKSYLESKELNLSGTFKLVNETFMSILVMFLSKAGSKFDSEIEDFLRWTAQYYERDCIEVKRNSIELLSWTLFQCPTGCETEELILNETEWLGKKIRNGLKDDFETYREALHVWAKAGDTVRAEAILDQMFHLAGKGSTALQPDLECCNTVLKCLSRSNGENAGVKGTALLARMRETQDIRPNHLSYHTVIRCWANSNHPNAMKNIGDTLSTMENDSDESNSLRLPDRMLYRYAMSVFKKNRQPQMTVSTLERMIDECRKGNLVARPLTDDFKNVLSSLQLLKQHDAVERGLAVVELMEELRKEGILDTKIKPILQNYLLFLKLWKPSGNAVTEQKARKIAEYVEKMSGLPDTNLTSDTLFNETIISFWAKLGDTERSEALLRRMYAEFLEKPGKGNEPNVNHLNSILMAWSSSGAPRAARRADAIVEHMKKLHGTKLNKCKPNATTYFYLQQCWKKSGLPEASDRLASIQKEKPE